MELKLTPREETKLNHKRRQHYWEQGLVPAAIHGRSVKPMPCFVNTKHSRSWHKGSMFEVTWNGTPYMASIDELQWEPVGHKLVHVSFHLVGKDEVTHISIPVRTTGHAPGEKQGGMVNHHLDSLTLSGKPGDMPEYIEIDVTSLQIGEKITVGDLTPPPGCEWYNHSAELPVITCSHIKTKPVEDEAPQPTAEAPQEAPATDKEAA